MNFAYQMKGPGIPDEEKKKIFERFYRIGNEATRKTQGTGLGLYLCKRSPADHNADISVTNNIPSRQYFYSSVYFHNRNMSETKKTSILLVEDEENLHEALKLNLELEGYDVTSAFDGAAALESN